MEGMNTVANEVKQMEPSKLLRPVQEDMMKRVRGTAKWSQLHKVGATFPAKGENKFLLDDEEEEEEEEDPKIHSRSNFSEPAKNFDIAFKPKGKGIKSEKQQFSQDQTPMNAVTNKQPSIVHTLQKQSQPYSG
jgi:hypothetical protein